MLIGVNYPPIHPNDRCTVTSAGKIYGKRIARDPKTGKNYKVRGDMTFEEWKRLVETLSYPHNENANNENAAFNIDKMCEGYSEFLTSLPQKNKMYLEFYAGTTEYVEKNSFPGPFGYSPNNDVIVYNPEFVKAFTDDELNIANTHELSHRIDCLYFESWKDNDFVNAVSSAGQMVMANKDAFQMYVDREQCSPYFSDIISALSKNKIDCFADHENDYWEIPTYKEKEIFANMFSVESLFKEDFEYIKNNLKPLYDAYMSLTEE